MPYDTFACFAGLITIRKNNNGNVRLAAHSTTLLLFFFFFFILHSPLFLLI